MSPEQEEQVCDALVDLGWLESDHALHAQAVTAIGTVLQCSTAEAKAVLGELRGRKLIEITITRDEVMQAHRTMPLTLRWVRPAPPPVAQPAPPVLE